MAWLCVCRVRQSYPAEAGYVNKKEQEIMDMWKALQVCPIPHILLVCRYLCNVLHFTSDYIFYRTLSIRLESTVVKFNIITVLSTNMSNVFYLTYCTDLM